MAKKLEPIPPGTRLSPRLTWGEFTTTQHREFLEEQANPPAAVRENAERFASEVFEPARALVGRPLQVNSGYRCPGLNRAIGGSKTSAHMLGLAADIFPLGMPLADAYELLAMSGLAFDQLILEFNRWIHIGAAKPGAKPRGERLSIFAPGRYELWRPDDSRIARVA
jgi:zinc D-Ala-D-Ala carboxypeptidase